MKSKFLDLLEELNENFSNELFEQLKESYENDLIIDELFKENQRAKEVINSSSIEFLEFLADNFVNDLNSFPEMYFLTYGQFFTFFGNNTFDTFLNISLDISTDDATDCINGMIMLKGENPEIALFHFNRIDNYISDYFIFNCYHLLENYENAIIAANNFLDEFEEFCRGTMPIENGEEIRMGDLNWVVFSKWDIINSLAYCYNAAKEYPKALKVFNDSIELVDLKSNYLINFEENILLGEYDQFLVFVNNYLLSLEKNKEYSQAIKTLDFVLSKYSNNIFYIKQKTLFQEKNDNISFADDIITKLFKPRKPFNIGKFEETKLISKEKNLEDMIIEQIKYGFKVFNKKLEVYKDNKIFGRQYYISSVNGFLDLLLIDKSTSIVYVVELKRNEAGIEVVEQTKKYMNGLKGEIKNEIRGIICLHKPKDKLIDLVAQQNDIELFTYNFEFTKIG